MYAVFGAQPRLRLRGALYCGAASTTEASSGLRGARWSHLCLRMWVGLLGFHVRAPGRCCCSSLRSSRRASCFLRCDRRNTLSPTARVGREKGMERRRERRGWSERGLGRRRGRTWRKGRRNASAARRRRTGGLVLDIPFPDDDLDVAHGDLDQLAALRVLDRGLRLPAKVPVGGQHVLLLEQHEPQLLQVLEGLVAQLVAGPGPPDVTDLLVGKELP